MKVFLSLANSKDNFINVKDINSLDKEVSDGEADYIECDDYLSLFNQDFVQDVLTVISKKVKLNGELLINEPDVVGLCLGWFLHKNSTLRYVNDRVFSNGAISNFIDIELIVQHLETNFDVSVNKFNGNITIRGIRIK